MPAQRTGRRPKAAVPAAGLLSLSLLLPVTATAQVPVSAFDTLTASLRLTFNVNHNIFHRYYSSDPGVELEIETPFYFGDAQLGFHYNSFAGRTREQPDFTSTYVFVGWGYEWQVIGRLDWRSGVRIGTFFTRFAGSFDNRSELELATAFDTRLSYRLASHWSADLSSRYEVVYTHERLRLVFLTLGAKYTFRTPNWLREFLK